MFNYIHRTFSVASIVLSSAIKYYTMGPRCPAWSLRMQLIRDKAVNSRRFKPNKAINDADINTGFDVEEIAEYFRNNGLPTSSYPPDKGSIVELELPVSEVDIDKNVFTGIGLASEGLTSLTEKDEKNKSRTIPYELVMSNEASDKLSQYTTDKASILSPHAIHPDERTVLYLHGGAYIMGSPKCYRLLNGEISNRTSLRCFVIDYRLAPIHPFPAQLHDAYIAFLYLVQNGFKPENIIIGGDSAGGNLALILTFLLRKVGFPALGKLVLLSPWCDLNSARASMKSNLRYDIINLRPVKAPKAPARLYLAPGKKLTDEVLNGLSDPWISPINGDFKDFPPTLIQSGRREILIDDIDQLHKNILSQNPDNQSKYVHEPYEGMVHVFQTFFSFSKETNDAIDSIGRFINDL